MSEGSSSPMGRRGIGKHAYPWEVVSRFRVPFAITSVAALWGILGYWLVFGWGLIDAVYMTAITITTVGFNEIRPVETVAIKLFTTSLVAFGVLALSSFISVFGDAVRAGEIKRVRKRAKSAVRLLTMTDHYIVCAYGRMGTAVARELANAGHSVAIVDLQPTTEDLARDEGYECVIGDMRDALTLTRAGVERARAVMCLASDPDVNLYCALSARSLNAKALLVARASESRAQTALQQAGVDRVISPYDLSGQHVADLMRAASP